MKLNIGCGTKLLAGYINVDIRESCKPDVVGDVMNLPFIKESIDEIQAIDVFEHRPYADSRKAIDHWVSLLKPGGVIYIQSPSITLLMTMFANAKTLDDVEWVIRLIFGGQDYPENFHTTICEPNLLAAYLKEAGITGKIEHRNSGANLEMRAYK
jgi:predicted SAM-dependent methyltransferase